jgi:hypothetical protein
MPVKCADKSRQKEFGMEMELYKSDIYSISLVCQLDESKKRRLFKIKSSEYRFRPLHHLILVFVQVG